MKNAAKPPRTKTTTASKLRMPQFMALARSESDLPKQVAQASAEWGAATRTKARSARGRIFFIASEVTDVFELSQNDFKVDHQGDARQGGTDRVDQIRSLALVLVNRIRPGAEAERQQDRRADKNDMECLKGHGAPARPPHGARVEGTGSSRDCHASPR